MNCCFILGEGAPSFFHLAILGVMVGVGFWLRFRKPRHDDQGSLRQSSYAPPRQRSRAFWPVIILCLVLVAASVYVDNFGSSKARGMAAMVDRVWLFAPLVLLGLLLVLVLILLLMSRDKELHRLTQSVNAYSPEKYESELEALINQKPTLRRYRALVIHQMSQQEFLLALLTLDRAENEFGCQTALDSDRALVLFKNGDFEKSLKLLDRLAKKLQEDVGVAAYRSQCLHILSRSEEAFAELDRAEYLYKVAGYPKIYAGIMDETRDKLGISRGFTISSKSVSPPQGTADNDTEQ